MLDDNVKIIYKPAQYDAIKELIDKRIADGSLHPDLVDNRLAELGLSIRSTDFATKLQNITSLSKIRSTMLQDIVDRLYADIITLYKSIEQAENTINFKNKKIQQQLAASQDIYLKVKSDVKAHIDGFKNPEYDEIRKITFYDKTNSATTESIAIVDQRGSKLKLNGRSVNIGTKTRVTPSFLLDADMYLVEGNVKSIIDSNPNTYWQTTVLSEALVPSFSVQIKLALSTIETLSSVSILPACPYPQKVSNLEHSIDGINWNVVAGFDPILATQNTDYVVIDFPAIQTRFIRITLEQFNGIFRDKLIPETVNDTTPEFISNRIGHNLSLIDYSDYDKRSAEIKTQITNAIIQSAIYSSNVLTRVNGYEYSFGIAEVALLNTVYDSSSSYLSRSFSNHKNAFLVELNTTEIKMPNTSIEYSLDLGDKIRIPILPKSYNSFIDNELLQFAGDSLTATVRFDIDMNKGVNVYKNGVQLSPYKYTFTKNTVTLLDAQIGEPVDSSTLYTVEYYALDGAAVSILDKIDSQPFDEIITGTSPNGEIMLKYFPFIEYGIVNDLKNFYYDNGNYIYSGDVNTLLAFSVSDPEIRLQVKESALTSLTNILYLDGLAYGNTQSTKRVYAPITIYVGEHKARNITNYIDDDQASLSQNPLGQTTYDYIQRGNTVTFGTRIIGKNITVRYNVLVKHIGLEAILRRTSTHDSSITPAIKDMTLFIKARNK